MAKGKGGFLGQDGLNAPNQATGVSATAGDESATVSFTAPANTGASDITGYQVQSNNGDGTYETSFDVADASYDSESFLFTSQDTSVACTTFKPDGTKMFIVGQDTDTVYRYNLSTAFDISTATYDSNSVSVSSQASAPFDVWFKPDGTTMYVVCNNTEKIYQYTLSTAWDLSTASYANKSLSTVHSSTLGRYPRGMMINGDGTSFYAFSSNDEVFYQYNATTAYDVSTASYASKSFDPDQNPDGSPMQGASFNDDGTELFVAGRSNDNVYRYDLSTAYDIGTASYSNVFGDVSAYDSNPNPSCVRFSYDGAKMFVTDFNYKTVYQFTTGLVGYPTSSPVTVTGLTNGTSYTFNVWAINSSGWSAPSEASGTVTPVLSRGLYSGGRTPNSNAISYISIVSTGDSQDFGDLQEATYGQSGCSSSTRGIFSTGAADSSRIEYVTIASLGNSTDFGNTVFGGSGYFGGSCSSSTRGLIAKGGANNINYITIASTGNATDFGDRTVSLYNIAGCSSPTRGLFGGGANTNPTVQNVIDYVTIASTGNATDFGNLTVAREQLGACSSDTRGVWGGGRVNSSSYNTIDYVTIASTGNATDFGDLTESRYGLAATGSNIRGVFGAGNSVAYTLDYITIASTGNATDYGDDSQAKRDQAACSSNHGGLQ